MILDLVHNRRIKENLDLDLAKVMDLTILKGYLSYPKISAACKMVVKYGFRSVCIPSRWLDTFRPLYPTLGFSTVVNYPFGYHSSDVVLREIQGVIGMLEDWERMEIDFVLPRDFNLFWEDYAEWNNLIPLRMILPWSSLPFIDNLLDYQIHSPQTIQLGTSFDFETPPKKDVIANSIDKLKAKGYKTKVAGITTPEDAREYLALGAELLGIGPRLAPIQVKTIQIEDENEDSTH